MLAKRIYFSSGNPLGLVCNRKRHFHRPKGFPRTPHVNAIAICGYVFPVWSSVAVCVCFAPRSHAVGESVFGPEV